MIVSPEIRVVIDRLQARRLMLEELMDVIPEDAWRRSAEPGAWDARTHLAHLATSDEPMRLLFEAALQGRRELLPFEAKTAADWVAARDAALAAVTGMTVAELRDLLRGSREESVRLLARLGPEHLERPVRITAVADAWGRPLVVSLRSYLMAWPTHEAEHEQAIRAAIAVPPSPAHLALAARRRR
jgi:hypothetical protein